MNTNNLEEIVNYLEISPLLGTAGQPLREQFAAIRSAGYQAVINLAMPSSTGALADEAEIVRGLGMEYVAIPVVWEAPQPRDFERFCAEMQRLAGRKVFAHCAKNYRVSAFVYLYRTLKLGAPEDVAYDDMLSIWQPEGVWAQFIERIKGSG